jgi:hypothetical protein
MQETEESNSIPCDFCGGLTGVRASDIPNGGYLVICKKCRPDGEEESTESQS